MAAPLDFTIIGAGPYGLSLAAMLGADPNLKHRIVGKPMHSWLTKMPKGMSLKSAGFSSNLIAPLEQEFGLRHFYEEKNLAFDPVAMPIPVDVFSAYGLAFQNRYVADVLDEHITELAPCTDGFRLTTENGTVFTTRKVVLATGIGEFAHIPEPLNALPTELMTHSSAHHDLQKFSGRKVAVIGNGSSGVDLAVLLHEAGADVTHIIRNSRTDFGCLWRDAAAGWWSRLRTPLSGIGPGWRNRVFADLPWGFRYLPEDLRLKIVRRHLGPAAGWFIAKRAEAVPKLYGHMVREAHVRGHAVVLRLGQEGASARNVSVDHVIAATGFKVDMRRLQFLHADLRRKVRLLGNYPRLNAHFESTVPGLFFVGPVAAGAFGPVMRFVFGAGFTCRQLAHHFSRQPTPNLNSGLFSA